MKDSRDEDMTAVLAGRSYPSAAVLATVCGAQNLQDELAIAQLSTFIKKSGFPCLVYVLCTGPIKRNRLPA